MNEAKRALGAWALLAMAVLVPQGAFAETGCVVPVEAASVRPGPEGEPTPVQVAYYVMDIESIDDAQQEFTADIVAAARWQDDRLGEVVRRNGAPCSFSIEEVWHPFLQFMNTRNVRMRLPGLVRVDETGTARITRRFYGTFSSPFDLREFPFDHQTLSFTVISFYDEHLVKLHAPPEESGFDESFSLPGWEIGEHSVTSSTYEARFGAGEVRAKSRADFTFEVERDIRYYQWKVVLPLVLIVFMSWSVFFVDPKQVGPQLGAASTSILTLIAFLFSLRGILPPISYLTRMDFFVYASLALVFVAYLEALFTVGLASVGREAVAQRIDRAARVVMPLAFSLIVARLMIG